jgi:fibronectin-binding autotransporter adhesin
LLLSGQSRSASFDIASGAVLELNLASGTRDGAVNTQFTGHGTLRKTGAGEWVWTGSAATFAMGVGSLIDIQGGRFTGGSFGNEDWHLNKSQLRVASGATFAGNEANVRVDGIDGAGLITSGYAGGGYTSFTMGVANGSGKFSGVLADSDLAQGHVGSFVKEGSGTQILSGQNTYTGGTTIAGGVLQVGDGGSSGAIVGNVLNNATLSFNRSDDASFAGRISGSGALIKTGSGTLTLAGIHSYTGTTTINGGTLAFTYAGNQTLSGAITGSGALTKSGRGTLTLGGGNSYTGATAINGGTLAFTNEGSQTLSGAITGSGALTKSGSGTLTLAGLNSYTGATAINGGTLAFTYAGNQTLSGAITGSGALLKSGAGTLTLGGTNTYSGGTTVGGGELSIARAANLGTGGLTLQGGTFTNTGDVVTSNAVTLLGAGGTFNTSGGYLSINGGVSGSGGLIKSGSKILTFNGDASYTGATSVQGGTLKVQNNGQASAPVGTSRIDIASGARMIFTGSHTVSAPITGAGQLVHEFGGTTTLAGNATHTGGTSIVGGQLRVGNGGTTGTLSGTVNNNGSLAFDRSDNTAFNGSIQGTGGVIKAGAGQLALSGTHSYTGTTTVEAGELKLDGSIAGSAVTVQAGARLSGNAQVGDLTVAGDLNPGNSPGLLTAGNTTFMGGGQFVWELQDADGAAGVGYDSLNVNGTLTLGGGSAPFVVALRSLALDGSAGDVAGFNVALDHRFTLVSTTGGILNYSPASIQLSLAGFSNDLRGGQWTIEQAGKSLDLVYTASVTSVPEPEGWALVLAGLGIVAWAQRQRRS